MAAVGIGIAFPRLRMSDTDQDQKTEQATDKRLSEAHERGQFAKSPELQVLILIAAPVSRSQVTRTFRMKATLPIPGTFPSASQ